MSDSVEFKKNNLSALRADITETTQVLKRTVDKLVDRGNKLVDRGDRLDVLTAKADDLNASSGVYYVSTRRVNRRMKWQNYKITIFIVAVVVIVIAVVIIIAVKPWKK